MSIGTALKPLLTTYASWLDMDDEQVLTDREEDPEHIRAIQILLHLPKGEATPSWHAALALAAAGCAALCLDERAEPGGEWFDAVAAYCRGHIRKVTRRGRGAKWEATADLPGLSLAEGGTQVRVLVPGLLSELDHRVAKLQVGGTDLPVDAEPVTVRAGQAAAGAPGAPLLTVHVPPPEAAAAMTAGKLMAQTGHAGMLTAALLAADHPDPARLWRRAGCPTRVVRTDKSEWGRLTAAAADPDSAWRERRLVAVRDAGFTEVDPGTVTAVGHLGLPGR